MIELFRVIARTRMTRYAGGGDPTRRRGNRGGLGEEGAIQPTVDANKREYRKQMRVFGDPLRPIEWNF